MAGYTPFSNHVTVVLIRRESTGPKGIPIERIRELADAGLNGPNIARTLGISPGAVYQRAKAHGIRMAKRAEGPP